MARWLAALWAAVALGDVEAEQLPEPTGPEASRYIRTIFVSYRDGTMDGHFSLGRAIGEAVGDDVRSVWAVDPELATLEQWTASGPGAEIYRNFVEDTNASYPLYFREVEGMAVGAQVPVRQMLLNNFREELTQFTDPYPSERPGAVRERLGHCTDAYVVDHKKGLTMWGHNDDWRINWRKAAYFVVVTALDKDDSVKFKFGSWVYPGYLLGMQLVWNSYGMVWTVDSLFQKDFGKRGVGTAWVARDMVYAKSLADLINLASPSGVSTAMNYNIGRLGSTSMWNLEVARGGVHAIREINDLYIHTNRFKVLDVEELGVQSSLAREARWSELRPGNFSELRQFLSDERDPVFPIYRNGEHGPDPAVTEVTGIFNIRERTISAWSQRSKDSPPELVLPLDFPGMPAAHAHHGGHHEDSGRTIFS